MIAKAKAKAKPAAQVAQNEVEPQYEVERVLAERRGGKEFKVKWKGYPLSEAT